MSFLLDSAETKAVNWAGAVFLYGSDVGFGGITFMAVKTITGEFFVEFFHQAVAGYFGNNRSGSDGSAAAVALDYRLLGVGQLGNGHFAIYEEEMRFDKQIFTA